MKNILSKTKRIFNIIKEPVIEAEQGGFKYVPKGHIANTGLVSPCIGVIIYNKKEQEAYVGHFDNPQIERCPISEFDGNPPYKSYSLKKMLKESLSKFGNPNNLETYVIGNSANENEIRDFVTSTIKNYGFQNNKTYVKWTNNASRVASLKLNTNSGKTEYYYMKARGIL